VNTILSQRFEEALVYATRLHAQQMRNGTQVPYVSHLLAVSSLVLEAGGGEDEAIAALLHDGPEDQGGRATLEEIRRLFGGPVAGIVAECSDTLESKKPPWQQRKEAYLRHLPAASGSARLVSCADKLHNARAILADYRAHGDLLWDRFNAGRDDILWYYSELARIFSAHGPPQLARELVLVVDQLHAEVAARGSTSG
jgi:(p)ppGpp synthase/HD superfamily hydrolase